MDLNLIDLSITNVTMEQALDLIESMHEGLHTIHFVNAHCINVAAKDPEYKAILSKADALLADGSGIRLAGKWLGTPIVDNVNGTDLFPLLCRRFADSGKRMFLLGSAPMVAEQAGRWACRQVNAPIIAGTHHGYFTTEDEQKAVIKEINDSGADLLLVALGVPRQEKWIDASRTVLNVPLCMGVGALFDFYSGTVPRAPMWMRKVGLEWAWRLAIEPRRMWRRYIVGNVVFILRLIKLRMRKSQRSR